jgi:formate-dependent nitrite reductase cytochrome c552 subunit
MRYIRRISVSRSHLIPAALVAAAAVLGLARLVLVEPAIEERQVSGRPVQLPDDGFVSSQTCRSCHPGQYQSWHRSYHRTMTQVATADTVAARFDDVTVDAAAGGPMRLEQRGRELWAEFDDPDDDQGGRGRTGVQPRRITRQVVMTTGSHHQQIYWYASGNSRVLGQLPAIWLTADRRWIPRRAAVMRPPGGAHVSETGGWNGICVACHTTNGQPQLDAPLGSKPIAAQAADTRATEFGVACESCHGPSGPHARANRNPIRRYAAHIAARGDASIVQPAHLPPARSSEVCGQCHSFWEFADEASERRANAHGLPYRPGDELAATRFIVQPTRNLESPAMKAFLEADAGFVRDIFWSDGMVRATGREYNGLIESPCFKNATTPERTMSCFSCHTMHQTPDDPRPIAEWANDQLAPAAVGNAACIQCHPSVGRGIAASVAAALARPAESLPASQIEAHTRHRAASSGSSCYNCHMPFTTYGLLKTIRSHQISSPSVQSTLATGRPNACNLCHLDKTLAWTAEYLERWYGIARPALNDDERAVAASVLVLLKGDAGQRAIVAESMGWQPAQEVSGRAWLTPYLALTAKDSYDAVRYIAARAQRTLPPFRRDDLPRNSPQLLIRADGTFDVEIVNRLVRARDNRRVFYRE